MIPVALVEQTLAVAEPVARLAAFVVIAYLVGTCGLVAARTLADTKAVRWVATFVLFGAILGFAWGVVDGVTFALTGETLRGWLLP